LKHYKKEEENFPLKVEFIEEEEEEKEEKFVCRKAVENDLLNCNKSVGTKKQNH
jgi:hypothetical protein